MRLDLVDFRAPAPGGVTAGLLSNWRVGAVLEAVAVRDGKGGQLWLDIGGQRHNARIASGDGHGPQSGERLQVRVLRNSPVLALETLSTRTASESDAVISDALRRYVPRQESPALLLANLAWLAQGKGGSEALPKGVALAAAQLWQALANAKTLSDPDGLRNALLRSGVFLESNLTTGAGAGGDLKALLLSLGQALRSAGARADGARGDASTLAPTPLARGPLTALGATPATLSLLDASTQQLNELARQTDGALARLTTVQIANSAPDATQSLLVELPVRHEERAGVLRFRIERESSGRNSDHGDAWSVEAAMDLGVIGALHAKVSLRGKRVSVQLRAESAGIVDALSARAGELEALLRESGLEVDRVVCLHGMPAGDAGERVMRLLDVRA